MVHVSSGSAVVLGLEMWELDVPPTTAYLLLGDRCSRDCAFCAQARSSVARADQLSRVSWPAYPATAVIRGLVAAYDRGAIQRCCLQVTAGRRYVEHSQRMVREIRAACALPLCVCVRATHLSLFGELLALGAERVTLGLDAACERVYNRVKGRDWQEALHLLQHAAERYPGHVGTHIIVGLGETEAEAVALLQAMYDLGVMTALFAFTPVPGTALAGEQPPTLAHYRRLQAARHLIVGGHVRAQQFSFSPDGQIISYGVDAARLRTLLGSGQAFQTSGCPGCNRPYYNERPVGPLYNYPRPLRPDEAAVATALVVDNLTDQ